MKRKTPLTNGAIHHVYSKSICHFQIFNTPVEYERFILLMRYYQFSGLKLPFSKFMRWIKLNTLTFEEGLIETTKTSIAAVNIIAYCLMPSHFHLIISQVADNGAEDFIGNICNGYSHYFNLRHNRKGPLWQNRFGNSRINNQQELLETSRYVHLNPSTSYLVARPDNWIYSSFREYVPLRKIHFPGICHTQYVLRNMSIKKYSDFVNNHIEIQRELKRR